MDKLENMQQVGKGGAVRAVGIPGLIKKIYPRNNPDRTIDLRSL